MHQFDEKPRVIRAQGEPVSPEKVWTAEEYLAWERQSPEKNELSLGRVFAMAGASVRHNVLVGNIVRLVGNALAHRPCQSFPSDMRVQIPATGGYRYPDATALCGAPEFEDDDEESPTLTNPEVIFEVLSTSTEAKDRGEKFEEYKSIRSFKEYVLLSQDAVVVEHFARQADGSWKRTEHREGTEVELGSLGIKLAVDELYLKVFKRPRVDDR